MRTYTGECVSMQALTNWAKLGSWLTLAGMYNIQGVSMWVLAIYLLIVSGLHITSQPSAKFTSVNICI